MKHSGVQNTQSEQFFLSENGFRKGPNETNMMAWQFCFSFNDKLNSLVHRERLPREPRTIYRSQFDDEWYQECLDNYRTWIITIVHKHWRMLIHHWPIDSCLSPWWRTLFLLVLWVLFCRWFVSVHHNVPCIERLHHSFGNSLSVFSDFPNNPRTKQSRIIFSTWISLYS